MPKRKGGSLQADQIQKVLENTYKETDDAPSGYTFDKDLSDDRVKVYKDMNSDQVIVAHRGSKGWRDWLDNARYAYDGDIKTSGTYKEAKTRQQKAIDKYGAKNIISVGHSRAGKYVEELNKEQPVKEVITYNKAVHPNTIFQSNPENQTDVRTSTDIVSALSPLQFNKNKTVTIPSGYDLLKAHKPSMLSYLGNKLIGKGYKQMRVADMRKFVKAYKKEKYGEKMTGGARIGKKELVSMLNPILEDDDLDEMVGGSVWTDFVKEFSARHGLKYACSLSKYKEPLKKAYKLSKEKKEWFEPFKIDKGTDPEKSKPEPEPEKPKSKITQPKSKSKPEQLTEDQFVEEYDTPLVSNAYYQYYPTGANALEKLIDKTLSKDGFIDLDLLLAKGVQIPISTVRKLVLKYGLLPTFEYTKGLINDIASGYLDGQDGVNITYADEIDKDITRSRTLKAIGRLSKEEMEQAEKGMKSKPKAEPTPEPETYYLPDWAKPGYVLPDQKPKKMSEKDWENAKDMNGFLRYSPSESREFLYQLLTLSRSRTDNKLKALAEKYGLSTQGFVSNLFGRILEYRKKNGITSKIDVSQLGMGEAKKKSKSPASDTVTLKREFPEASTEEINILGGLSNGELDKLLKTLKIDKKSFTAHGINKFQKIIAVLANKYGATSYSNFQLYRDGQLPNAKKPITERKSKPVKPREDDVDLDEEGTLKERVAKRKKAKKSITERKSKPVKPRADDVDLDEEGTLKERVAKRKKMSGRGMRGGNKWTDFVKDYAKRDNTTYGCALSDAGTKNAYKLFKDGKPWWFPKAKEIETQTGEFVEPDPPPVPEKALEPTISRIEEKVKILEDVGRKKGAVSYDAAEIIANVAFVNLMLKYNAKCIIANVEKPLGLDVGININAVKGVHDYYKTTLGINNLGPSLKNCIDRGVQLIVIPLSLQFSKSKTAAGHANMLVYRPFQRIIERFEPHGRQYGSSDKDNASINAQLKQLFEEDLNRWVGPIRFRDPDDICPSGKGFQALENQLGQIKSEGGGFCSMWSLFLAEMTMLNPTKSTKEILDEVFDITKRDPQYLKSVIRGYVVEVEKGLDLLLKGINSPGFRFGERAEFVAKIPDLTKWLLATVFDTKKFKDAPPQYEPLPGVILKTKSDLDRQKETYSALLNAMTKNEVENIFGIYGLQEPKGKKDIIVTILLRAYQEGGLQKYGSTGLRDLDVIVKNQLHKKKAPYEIGMARDGYFTDILDLE